MFKGTEDSTANKVSYIVEGYGWLNTIYRLAQGGVFNRGNNLNSIENVEETKLREVLTFMSWESANIKYEMEYQRIAQKKANNKGGMSY